MLGKLRTFSEGNRVPPSGERGDWSFSGHTPNVKLPSCGSNKSSFNLFDNVLKFRGKDLSLFWSCETCFFFFLNEQWHGKHVLIKKKERWRPKQVVCNVLSTSDYQRAINQCLLTVLLNSEHLKEERSKQPWQIGKNEWGEKKHLFGMF